MLIQITRTRRLRAGAILALLYVLCVTAPSIALALPGMPTPDCLSFGSAHSMTGMSEHSTMMSHEHEHVDHMAMTGDEPAAPHQHKSSGTSCCELMCLTGLPTALLVFSQPVLRHSVCELNIGRATTDNTPTRLYRPPIS